MDLFETGHTTVSLPFPVSVKRLAVNLRLCTGVRANISTCCPCLIPLVMRTPSCLIWNKTSDFRATLFALHTHTNWQTPFSFPSLCPWCCSKRRHVCVTCHNAKQNMDGHWNPWILCNRFGWWISGLRLMLDAGRLWMLCCFIMGTVINTLFFFLNKIT